MRCNKARENLSLEVDGILPPDSTIDLQKHLDGCADCRQYREDIMVGQRLLAATEPRLSDNFEWRLQLKLNQTLQAAAGRERDGWEEEPSRLWPWLRNFGAAASVGLAAVLTVAMLVGPGGMTSGPGEESGSLAAGRTADTRTDPVTTATLAGADRGRLEIDSRWRGLQQNQGLVRFVSGGGAPNVGATRTGAGNNGLMGLRDGWSGSDVDDLVTINRLRAENHKLQRLLFATEQELRKLRAQLDTTEIDGLDLGVDQE